MASRATYPGTGGLRPWPTKSKATVRSRDSKKASCSANCSACPPRPWTRKSVGEVSALSVRSSLRCDGGVDEGDEQVESVVVRRRRRPDRAGKCGSQLAGASSWPPPKLASATAAAAAAVDPPSPSSSSPSLAVDGASPATGDKRSLLSAVGVVVSDGRGLLAAECESTEASAVPGCGAWGTSITLSCFPRICRPAVGD